MRRDSGDLVTTPQTERVLLAQDSKMISCSRNGSGLGWPIPLAS